MLVMAANSITKYATIEGRTVPVFRFKQRANPRDGIDICFMDPSTDQIQLSDRISVNIPAEHLLNVAKALASRCKVSLFRNDAEVVDCLVEDYWFDKRAKDALHAAGFTWLSELNVLSITKLATSKDIDVAYLHQIRCVVSFLGFSQSTLPA